MRKKAEAREKIPHVAKRIDSKGRSQFAHKRNAAKHSPQRTKSAVDLSDRCINAVRETIERTLKDLQWTGAATFEELFAALAKVLEDIKRSTPPRDERPKLTSPCAEAAGYLDFRNQVSL